MVEVVAVMLRKTGRWMVVRGMSGVDRSEVVVLELRWQGWSSIASP